MCSQLFLERERQTCMQAHVHQVEHKRNIMHPAPGPAGSAAGCAGRSTSTSPGAGAGEAMRARKQCNYFALHLWLIIHTQWRPRYHLQGKLIGLPCKPFRLPGHCLADVARMIGALRLFNLGTVLLVSVLLRSWAPGSMAQFHQGSGIAHQRKWATCAGCFWQISLALWQSQFLVKSKWYERAWSD